MKKSALPLALLLIAAGLSGCPIYDDDTVGCFDDLDCGSGYLCDDRTGSCYAEARPDSEGVACRRPTDCDPNETCARDASCRPGDCHFASVGCVRGYVCSSVSGRWECVAENAGQAGGGAGEGAGPVTGGAPGSGGTPSEPQGGMPSEPQGGMPMSTVAGAGGAGGAT